MPAYPFVCPFDVYQRLVADYHIFTMLLPVPSYPAFKRGNRYAYARGIQLLVRV
jgi:hypothetical protein